MTVHLGFSLHDLNYAKEEKKYILKRSYSNNKLVVRLPFL